MSFEYPYALFLIAALFLCEFLCKKRGVKSVVFSHTEFLTLYKDSKIDKILYLLIMILLTIAIANPYKKVYIGSTHTKGRNIVIVLDNSPSMYWSFGEGSKIGVAKRIIKEFILKRRFDNIGLVVFAGEVYYLAPITTNHDYIFTTLSKVDKEFLEGGTALYDSIEYAIRVFKDSKSKNNILIVLTDGEDTESSLSLSQLLNSLKFANAKTYTIGIGNSINEDVLKKIGEYYNATSPSALQTIYDKIDRIEKYNVKTKKYYKKIFYFQELLLLGSFLLIILIGKEYYAVFKR